MHDEISRISACTLLNGHNTGELIPHAIFPCEIILLHTLIIVPLASLANPHASSFRQRLVDLAANDIIVLVRPIAQSEYDVLQAGELVCTIAKGEVILAQVRK